MSRIILILWEKNNVTGDALHHLLGRVQTSSGLAYRYNDADANT